uniref:Uncharacterized protein n=1 Tax=Rhizophora mucronata TaxID=61149 RepID=A0A2P2QTA1_RHIMU
MVVLFSCTRNSDGGDMLLIIYLELNYLETPKR